MKPKVSPSFKASNFHEEQSDVIRGSRLGPVAGEAKTAPSAKVPDEFKRLPPGLGSNESLDGDGEPGAAGTHTCPGSLPPPSQAHPPVTGWLLHAAAASRCSRDPTCRKVPGEKSQGFLPPGGAGGEEAGRGGVWVTHL